MSRSARGIIRHNTWQSWIIRNSSYIGGAMSSATAQSHCFLLACWSSLVSRSLAAFQHRRCNRSSRQNSLTFSDPASWAVANAPYYWLQSLILSTFGISVFTIKLPSLILALVSAVGLILLLRRWFKPNIAVLVSLIAISTGQFLFIAQQGTPGYSVHLLANYAPPAWGLRLLGGKRYRFLWKVLFCYHGCPQPLHRHSASIR